MIPFEDPSFGIPLSFILGAIWGSFFNVCIYRLPIDEPVHKGFSKCPHCKTPIAWYWNIPILGWLMLRGKSACCKKPISVQYPLVELGTALSFVALYFRFGASVDFFWYALFTGALLVISVIDLHHRIIPDEISLPGVVIGVIAALTTGPLFWWESLLGAALGYGLFFGIAWFYEKLTGREGLGGGDVKLLAMLGAWLGPQSIPLIILLSTGMGSIVGILYMMYAKKNLQAALPFGPFLAIAGEIYLFYGDALNAWL